MANRKEWENPNAAVAADATATAAANLAASVRPPGGPDTTTSSGGGSGSYTSVSLTPRESANTRLDQQMIELFGRRASNAEKAAFFKQLNAMEKKYATRGGSGRTTSYSFDANAFLYDYVTSLAANEIRQGKELGGQSGQLFRNIKASADAMGIPMSEETALDTSLKIITGQKDETTVIEDFRKRAISLYAGLADRLNADPNLTVRDAAGDYIETMAKYFDLNPKNISLFDPTLTKAINHNRDGKPATKTMSEFIGDLRNDERFQYGAMAQQEARNLGSSIANLFR